MSGNLQIYCTGHEYPSWRSRPPLWEFMVFSIIVDKSEIGATVSDYTKNFSIENGAHQISIRQWPWRPSAPLDVVVQENQTIPLVCGINREWKLFIEPEVPSSIAAHRLKEETLRYRDRLYGSPLCEVAWVIGLLLGAFIILEISMHLQNGGVQLVLIVILLCLSIPLLAVGVLWMRRKIIGKSRQPKN